MMMGLCMCVIFLLELLYSRHFMFCCFPVTLFPCCRYNNYYNFADFFVTIMIITLAKGHYCHRYYTSQSMVSMLLLYTKKAHGYI